MNPIELAIAKGLLRHHGIDYDEILGIDTASDEPGVITLITIRFRAGGKSDIFLIHNMTFDEVATITKEHGFD